MQSYSSHQKGKKTTTDPIISQYGPSGTGGIRVMGPPASCRLTGLYRITKPWLLSSRNTPLASEQVVSGIADLLQ